MIKYTVLISAQVVGIIFTIFSMNIVLPYIYSWNSTSMLFVLPMALIGYIIVLAIQAKFMIKTVIE